MVNIDFKKRTGLQRKVTRVAKYEKYPPDMKNIPPISSRHLLGISVLIVAGVFGYFESWGNFGLSLGLAIIVFLGVYLENQYRRIAKRLDQLQDLVQNILEKIEREDSADETGGESAKSKS